MAMDLVIFPKIREKTRCRVHATLKISQFSAQFSPNANVYTLGPNGCNPPTKELRLSSLEWCSEVVKERDKKKRATLVGSYCLPYMVRPTMVEYRKALA